VLTSRTTALKTSAFRVAAIGAIAAGLLWATAPREVPPVSAVPAAKQQAAVKAADVRLYHVPIAVNDLEAAARMIQQLGFSIKPGSLHKDGIRNVHAKFHDGTEIELITAPKQPTSQTAKAYRALIDRADGPAYLALYVRDLEQVSQRLVQIGQQHQRSKHYVVPAEKGPLPYVFYAPGGPDAILNRSPTDRPEHFRHANGALRLDAVWLASDDFGRLQNLLTSLGGALNQEVVAGAAADPVLVATLASGKVVMLPARHQTVPGRILVGLSVEVASLDQTRRYLAGNRVAFQERNAAAGRSLIVAPGVAAGTWFEFREAAR
jgi:Glyoxalase-like domain